MPKLNLKIPVINACGILSYLDSFERLEKEGACFGAWIPKSIGPFSSNPELRKKYGWDKEKLGNPNPVVVHTGHVLLNSMALPTHPVESWIKEFEETKLEKPIIGSVYGFKPEDYAILIEMVDKYVDAWELNVSCPNKEEGEDSLMETMTSKVETIVKPLKRVTEKPLIVKLSPNEDYVSLARLVKDYVDCVGCGNTVGPGLVIDIYSRRPILAGIYGGMSGPAIKPKNMKMVNDIYQVVKDSEIEIIAYGGIESWEDVIEYAIAGASFFGLGTSLLKVENGFVKGKTTEEIVELSNQVWGGVQKYLKEGNTNLDKIIGSMVI